MHTAILAAPVTAGPHRAESWVYGLGSGASLQTALGSFVNKYPVGAKTPMIPWAPAPWSERAHFCLNPNMNKHGHTHLDTHANLPTK